jgi:hypothetical protein
MSYGPDTHELLRRLSTIVDGKLDLYNLNIHSLPKLPVGLVSLFCYYTKISRLPPTLKICDLLVQINSVNLTKRNKNLNLIFYLITR